nr:MAG TPA: hypothetical protein [Bacteriophage sp.]
MASVSHLTYLFRHQYYSATRNTQLLIGIGSSQKLRSTEITFHTTQRVHHLAHIQLHAGTMSPLPRDMAISGA